MDTAQITKVFKADKTLASLKEMGDFFGIGDELVEQLEDDMADFYDKGQKWANKCRLRWSELKTGVPWATGNLSFSITAVDEFEDNKPQFWVGVDLKKLLEPKGKKLPITNYIDYGNQVDKGKMRTVADKDYTAIVDSYNRTGPDHFIEDVWHKYASIYLAEVMK